MRCIFGKFLLINIAGFHGGDAIIYIRAGIAFALAGSAGLGICDAILLDGAIWQAGSAGVLDVALTSIVLGAGSNGK